MSFGTIPYKRAWYLDVVSSGSVDMRPLICVLEMLRNGNFEEVRSLVPLLTHSSLDARLYAQQLFADVCSNDDACAFNLALEASKTLDETRRIVLRMGQTLSLSVIPILLTWREALNDPEIDEYVCDALSAILPIDGVDQFSVSRPNLRKTYEAKIASLDASSYYYRGKKLFLGDIAKELIVASTVAFKEKTKVIAASQAQILSNFCGQKCPVVNGQLVTGSDMDALLSYVEVIAATKWKVGSKYFFRHEIATRRGDR